jgi:peroxidase
LVVLLCLGDPRVNENAGLGTIHILFVRYHNVIEAELHKLNPHWSGERLFQETRRIIIAILQHITYNEWLPLLLGPNVIRKFELDLQAQGYYEGNVLMTCLRVYGEN